MTKQKKQFSPHLYPEWGELFDAISNEERGELLLAITKFPEYEPKIKVSIWNFIKSQLQKDYDLFLEKCEKNGEVSRNYWKNKKTNDTERLSNDTERHPKLITNNELLITKTNNELLKQKIDNKESSHITSFLSSYKEICTNLPQVKELSSTRRNKIKARLKNAPLETWKQVFQKINDSEFCCGKNDRKWTASFDWLIANDNNYVKVLEGKYDNKIEKKYDYEEAKKNWNPYA